MPDLREKLEGAAAQLRTSSIPAFRTIEARARRRRQRSVVAAAVAVVVSVGAIAVGTTALVDDELSLLYGPAGQPGPSSREPAWPPGATEEPRPFTVPTTDPGADVLPPIVGEISTSGVSVPWVLMRIWDDGRALRIEHALSCVDTAAGDVRVLENPEWVLVQALSAPDPAGRDCTRDPGRADVRLRDALGDRPLLHAPTGNLGDSPDPRTLADRFADPPVWPGDPWHRDGRAVPRHVLVLAEGPEHCNWESAAVLAGTAVARDDTVLYWRDPKGALEHAPQLQQEFQARAELPPDAAYTGWTQRGVELWTAPSDRERYVYLVRVADRSDVERWVEGTGGCL